MEEMQKNMSIDKMFYILGAVYFVMMFIGHLLLAKPSDWHEPSASEKKPTIMEVLKTKPLGNYIGIWLMFFLNITCGLAIISYEKQLFITAGFVAIAGTLGAVSAVFNAAGRLGFSAWADKMKDRNTIYKMIFILSILFTIDVPISNCYYCCCSCNKGNHQSSRKYSSCHYSCLSDYGCKRRIRRRLF